MYDQRFPFRGIKQRFPFLKSDKTATEQGVGSSSVKVESELVIMLKVASDRLTALESHSVPSPKFTSQGLARREVYSNARTQLEDIFVDPDVIEELRLAGFLSRA